MPFEVVAAAVLAAAFLVFALILSLRNRSSSNGKQKEKKKKGRSTIDLFFDNAEVDDDGLIRVGRERRLAFRVQPVNMLAMSDEEQDQVWHAFRSYVAAMSIPHTFILTSQYMRLSDYIMTMEESIRKLGYDRHPGLGRSAGSVIEYLRLIDESGGIRETQGYIIIRFDPGRHLTGGVVETGIGPLDDLVSNLSPEKKLNPKEEDEIARQILIESELLLLDTGKRIGMRVERLDRKGVYALGYQILQRDIAHALSLDDVPKEASRSSLTPSKRPNTGGKGRDKAKSPVFRVGETP